MASTTPKKTTSAAKKKGGTATRAKKPAQPQKRPVRREVGGIALLVLALCVSVSYFKVQAIFVDWFAILLKGLFGYGYWLAGPALLLAAIILLFHHGRPVQLRVTCALLLPGLLGALLHLVLSKETYESGIGILAKLWKSGGALASGGAVSGALAEGSAAVFSPVVSIILFMVVLLLVVLV